MFQGEYQHGLDTKGRLILPVRIREELGTQFVLTKGLDGCLFIFTPSAWMDFSDKLNQLPTSSKEARKLKRYFIGSSIECETDKQGRFLIPPVLRNFAEIDKEVKVIIDDCYAKAKAVILKHEEILHKCAELLLEKERINRDEFEALFC